MRCKYKVAVLPTVALVLAAAACSDTETPLAADPSGAAPRLGTVPMGDPYTYACGKSIAPDQAAANTQIQNDYASWKGNLVTSSGAPAGTQRVRRPSDNDDTVSEGIGYGMILAVHLNDRTTFDNLWRYAKHYRNSRGLMSWHVSATGQVLDPNAATDADEDMAFALIAADKKWGGYASDAKTLIANILGYEVDSNNVLKPGDVWGGTSQTNPSYFAPGYFKIFQTYTGASRWSLVTDKSYEIIANVNAKPASGNTGLQPDWTDANGNPVPGSSYDYRYDATRVPWRLAKDAVWYCGSRARSQLDRLNAFFKGIGAVSIKDGYKVDGSLIGQYHNASFVGPAGAGSLVSGDAAYQRSLWDETVRLTSTNYYHSSLRLLAMLLMSGNMPNPIYTLRDGFESGSTSRWGTMGDAGSTITRSAVSPGGQGSYAMRVDYSIASWGGINANHVSAPEDWSTHQGLEFWLSGTGSGNIIRLEILDNRGPGSTSDTSERWEYRIRDDFSGWRQFSVPWSSFTRRTDWQPAGAPNDGFTLTDVWGYNFSPLSGTGSFRLDQVQLLK